ncbi:hypothetical protein MCOR02_000680 [Pyricularia oryzae]|nr:hypothetical protein MCOR02_000680 [Pyricularia oryzae]
MSSMLPCLAARYLRRTPSIFSARPGSATTAPFSSCRKSRKQSPASRKYSAEVAPRVPALKLSMKRTVWRSRGTVVPPEVTSTTRRLAAACCSMKAEASATCSDRPRGGGLLLK